jgi:4-aminobutyrate aminotransferase
MLAAEFGAKQADGSYAAPAGVASRLTKAAGARGLLLLGAGARETVRFLPPLNISAGEVEEGLAIFEDSLAEVFGGSGAST